VDFLAKSVRLGWKTLTRLTFEMHDVSVTAFYAFMVLRLNNITFLIIYLHTRPQCIKALVGAQLGLGLNRLSSAGSGLEAWPSTSLVLLTTTWGLLKCNLTFLN
jgi:hypothetical protein